MIGDAVSQLRWASSWWCEGSWGIPGTSRALVVHAEGFCSTWCAAERTLELSFFLPSGSYATTLMRELFEDVEVAREPLLPSREVVWWVCVKTERLHMSPRT